MFDHSFLGISIENWAALLTAIYTVVNIIVAATPTPKDDEILRKILDRFSFLAAKDAKGTLKMPFVQESKKLVNPTKTVKD